ncbi:MAG: ECF-type sigma factor [Gemmatimonadota bacterium]|nr:ECF-type sigma factor [Gemmatimonadota bacterium]
MPERVPPPADRPSPDASLEGGGCDVSDPDFSARIYDELRAIAARHMARERAGHPLRPTELVHEAYLKLSSDSSPRFASRNDFLRIASHAMRQVLVDAARRRDAVKRGGDRTAVTMDVNMAPDDDRSLDLLELHDALRVLGRMDSRLERLVELRFFTGLTLEEVAETLGVSRRKASKDWAAARLWLRRELAPG